MRGWFHRGGSKQMSRQNILRVSGLNAGYRGIQVLWDIDIVVPKNSIVSMIGANGAGKSTMVKAICGLLPVMSGKVEFNGEDITRLMSYERVAKRLILIPDERGLFPEMTVYENLIMGGYTVSDQDKVRKAIDWGCEMFPVLKKRSGQNAGCLSGGEQQMLAIAKALVSQPELLILDEPSSGLAPIIIDKMFEVLGDIRDKGITIFLVEQNVRRSLNISDYCYALENGKIGMQGESASLRSNDDIRALYLGM